MDTNDKDTQAGNESKQAQSGASCGCGGGRNRSPVGSESKNAQSDASNPMMMGMGMAKKMMSEMGKGDSRPMAMMQKMMAQMKPGEGGKPPMEQMMGMCMGMCGEMLTAIQQTTAMAAFATPELRQMFVEWMAMLETEALKALNQKDATDMAGLAQKLNISEESAAYLIAHMAKQGKVNLQAETKKAL